MSDELQYQVETAGEHLVRGAVTTAATTPVSEVLASLVGPRWGAVDPVCVLDGEGRLVGTAPLAELLAQPGTMEIGAVMQRDPPAVPPGLDQERVAALARSHGLAAVPVVDADGRFLGLVPPQAMLDVLYREHVEDMHRLAGIVHGRVQARAAMESSPWARVRQRLPWLLIGLVGSMVAAGVMGHFESVLERDVAIAFFVPVIVYLADAIGTQTEAVAVRGLSLGHRPLGRLLAGELATGTMMGLALGFLALPAVFAGVGDLRLAAAVAVGILSAGSMASCVGLIFPWLLSRSGWDPAYGSGPVATIIQDVLSILVYFAAVITIV